MVVGLGAAIIVLCINVPATIFITLYVTEYAKKSVADRNEIKPVASEGKNEGKDGHTFFRSDVEIDNPGPRAATGAKIRVKPFSCALTLELESASTFPDADSVDFEDAPKPSGGCDSHIVTISRLRAGQKLVLHYVVRSDKFIATPSPVKPLNVAVQDVSYKDPLSKAVPYANPTLNEATNVSPKAWSTQIVTDECGFGLYQPMFENPADVIGSPFALKVPAGANSPINMFPYLEKLFVGMTTGESPNVAFTFSKNTLSLWDFRPGDDAYDTFQPYLDPYIGRVVILAAGTSTTGATCPLIPFSSCDGASTEPNDSSLWLYGEFAKNRMSTIPGPGQWGTSVANQLDFPAVDPYGSLTSLRCPFFSPGSLATRSEMARWVVRSQMDEAQVNAYLTATSSQFNGIATFNMTAVNSAALAIGNRSNARIGIVLNPDISGTDFENIGSVVRAKDLTPNLDAFSPPGYAHGSLVGTTASVGDVDAYSFTVIIGDTVIIIVAPSAPTVALAFYSPAWDRIMPDTVARNTEFLYDNALARVSLIGAAPDCLGTPSNAGACSSWSVYRHLHNAYASGDLALPAAWSSSSCDRTLTGRMLGFYSIGSSVGVIGRGYGWHCHFPVHPEKEIADFRSRPSDSWPVPACFDVAKRPDSSRGGHVGATARLVDVGSTSRHSTNIGKPVNVEVLDNNGADLQVRSSLANIKSDGVVDSRDLRIVPSQSGKNPLVKATVLDSGGAKLLVTTRVR